jgi:hypothetical protein
VIERIFQQKSLFFFDFSDKKTLLEKLSAPSSNNTPPFGLFAHFEGRPMAEASNFMAMRRLNRCAKLGAAAF